MSQKRHISQQEALARLMDTCSRAEKSPFEIEKKLVQWGLEAHTSTIIDRLKKERFLDEERFAKAFARDKSKLNKWGKIKIRFALNAHKISSEDIKNALEQIEPEFYSRMIDDELNKKLKSLKTKNMWERKAKLYAFGNQRGYETEEINRYLSEKGL
jgi:regulatory protein